jgi:hypothetical protein
MPGRTRIKEKTGQKPGTANHDNDQDQQRERTTDL